jgi:hypothetical protein
MICRVRSGPVAYVSARALKAMAECAQARVISFFWSNRVAESLLDVLSLPTPFSMFSIDAPWLRG